MAGQHADGPVRFAVVRRVTVRGMVSGGGGLNAMPVGSLCVTAVYHECATSAGAGS